MFLVWFFWTNNPSGGIFVTELRLGWVFLRCSELVDLGRFQSFLEELIARVSSRFLLGGLSPRC